VEIIRENGNIKVDLREIDCDCVNGTEETQGMAQMCVCDGRWNLEVHRQISPTVEFWILRKDCLSDWCVPGLWVQDM